MSERVMLPVLPLRETVVFPGVAVPISAGRPGTLQAIEAALAADRRVFAVAQKENRDEVEIDNLYTVGTIVRIAQVQRGVGGMQLLIHGDERALALNYLETPDQGLRAGVIPMDDLEPVQLALHLLAGTLAEVQPRDPLAQLVHLLALAVLAQLALDRLQLFTQQPLALPFPQLFLHLLLDVLLRLEQRELTLDEHQQRAQPLFDGEHLEKPLLGG